MGESRRPIARPAVDGIEPEILSRRKEPRPRRNKLVYKNRWLISVNVVAALRRAGVDCDIVIPGPPSDIFLSDGALTARKRGALARIADDNEVDREVPPVVRLH